MNNLSPEEIIELLTQQGKTPEEIHDIMLQRMSLPEYQSEPRELPPAIIYTACEKCNCTPDPMLMKLEGNLCVCCDCSKNWKYCTACNKLEDIKYFETGSNICIGYKYQEVWVKQDVVSDLTEQVSLLKLTLKATSDSLAAHKLAYNALIAALHAQNFVTE